jgi:hypothetical protein
VKIIVRPEEKMKSFVISLIGVLVLSGCTPLPTRSQSPLIDSLPLDHPTSAPTSQAQTELIQRAINDLAQRLSIDPISIKVQQVIADEFPAPDLGCPPPDRTPLPQPALISGQRILLQAAEQVYEYRAKGTELRYCGTH